MLQFMGSQCDGHDVVTEQQLYHKANIPELVNSRNFIKMKSNNIT